MPENGDAKVLFLCWLTDYRDGDSTLNGTFNWGELGAELENQCSVPCLACAPVGLWTTPTLYYTVHSRHDTRRCSFRGYCSSHLG